MANCREISHTFQTYSTPKEDPEKRRQLHYVSRQDIKTTPINCCDCCFSKTNSRNISRFWLLARSSLECHETYRVNILVLTQMYFCFVFSETKRYCFQFKGDLFTQQRSCPIRVKCVIVNVNTATQCDNYLKPMEAVGFVWFNKD